MTLVRPHCTSIFVGCFVRVFGRLVKKKKHDCPSHPPITSARKKSHCFIFFFWTGYSKHCNSELPWLDATFAISPSHKSCCARYNTAALCKQTCTKRNHCKYTDNEYRYSREQTLRPEHTCWIACHRGENREGRSGASRTKARHQTGTLCWEQEEKEEKRR